MTNSSVVNRIQILFILLASVSCASKGPYQLDLMPAPDIYDIGSVNPFDDHSEISERPYPGVLYATDRLPATDNEGKDRFYQNERGHLLRLGVGKIDVGDGTITWAEARRVSLLKNRPSNYPMRVSSVKEFGILKSSYHDFVDTDSIPPESSGPGDEFAALINDKLAKSRNKDVYIYTHGYKVNFENPLLVAAELWHFLGYDGAFIAFSWPSTPKTSAYARDLETAANSARGMRLLVEFLSRNTDVDRINIIGYSAGTRVVVNAMSQLAMITKGSDSHEMRKSLRIGHVILVASDLDRTIFGFSLNDDLLDVVDDITVYMSETDKALGVSKFLFSRQRLGQPWAPGTLKPNIADYFKAHPSLVMIDVSGAAGADSGNGHAYFRQSPWVSSDLLMALMFDLKPANRGLQVDQATGIWSFPDNYVESLSNDIDTYVRQR